MPLDFKPQCKYAHGDLVMDPDTYGAVSFAVHGPASGADELAQMIQTDIVFTTRLFVCPTCGYVEHFDTDKVDK